MNLLAISLDVIFTLYCISEPVVDPDYGLSSVAYVGIKLLSRMTDLTSKSIHIDMQFTHFAIEG